MEIILHQKSEFGDFQLVPTKGFQFSHHFIDYESKWLIVHEIRFIDARLPIAPTFSRVIDPNIPKILSFEEYQHFFNYELQETWSEDKTLKLLSQRLHDEKSGREFFEQKLIEVQSEKMIDYSLGVGFRKDKRETLLERYYQSKSET